MSSRQSSTQFHAQVWQSEIERGVNGTSRDPSVGTCALGLQQQGLLTFCARDLVTFLVSSGRCKTRPEGVHLSEALRARDVIRPLKGSDSRFSDYSSRWVCRADEAPSPDTSFSVAAVMNRPDYILAAPMFKQGQFFLNSRFFILDRAECRLYVYNTDYSLLPRYYIDFRRQPCVITAIVPSSGAEAGGVFEVEKDYSSDASDTDDDEGGPAVTPAVKPWLPPGTGASSLPLGKAASWGFTISGPGNLKVQAYAASKRRAVVWIRALASAAACKISRDRRSHTQLRLGRMAPIAPLKPMNISAVDATVSSPLAAFDISPTPLSALASDGVGGFGASGRNNNNSSATIKVGAESGPESGEDFEEGRNVNPVLLSGNSESSNFQETDDYLPGFFTPTSVRQLLAIPQSHVRRVLPPSWGENYSLLRHEALAESKASGDAASITHTNPPWATVSEELLWGASCRPETLLDLYAWPLEVYVSCLSLTIQRLDRGGLEEDDLHDNVAAATPPTQLTAANLSHLRYLLFDPSRCTRDLGIFIPAHIRAVLERIAAFVPPLALEFDVPSDLTLNSSSVESSQTHPPSHSSFTLSVAPTPMTGSPRMVESAGFEMGAMGGLKSISRGTSMTIFSAPSHLVRSTSKIFGRELSTVALLQPSGIAQPPQPSTSTCPTHGDSGSGSSSSVGEALKMALRGGSDAEQKDRSTSFGGGGVVGKPPMSFHSSSPSASTLSRSQSRVFSSPSRKSSIASTSRGRTYSVNSRKNSISAQSQFGGSPTASPTPPPVSRPRLSSNAQQRVSFSLPRGTSSHSFHPLLVSSLPMDTPYLQTNRKLAQNAILQAFREYAHSASVMEGVISPRLKGLESVVSQRSSPGSSSPVILPSAQPAGIEKLVLLGWGGATLPSSHFFFEKGEEERLADALLPKEPATVGDGTRELGDFEDDGGSEDMDHLSEDSPIPEYSEKFPGGSTSADRPNPHPDSNPRHHQSPSNPSSPFLSQESEPWVKLGISTCENIAVEVSRTAAYVHSLFSFNRMVAQIGSSNPCSCPTAPLHSQEGCYTVAPDEWRRLDEALGDWIKEKRDVPVPLRKRGDSLDKSLSYGVTDEGKDGEVAASDSPVATLYRGASRILLNIPATPLPSSSRNGFTAAASRGDGEEGLAAPDSHTKVDQSIPLQPILPLDLPLLRKTMELCTARLKGLLVAQVTAVLTSGGHPMSLLLQRCCSALVAVYGPETFPYLGVSEEGGSLGLKSDLRSVLNKISALARPWVTRWLGEIEEWGSTAGALNPSPRFLSSCLSPPWLANPPDQSSLSVVPGLAGLFFSVANVSVQRGEQPRGEVERGVAIASPLRNAVNPLAGHHKDSWKLVCRLAKSFFLSERDISEVAMEGVSRAILEAGELSGIIQGFYRTIHEEADSLMASRQRLLFGLTTTQLDLAEELRIDACIESFLSPSTPLDEKKSSVDIPQSPIFSLITSSTLVACAVLPVGLPLPSLNCDLIPFFNPYVYQPSAQLAQDSSAEVNAAAGEASQTTAPWPVYSLGKPTQPAALAAVQPALEIFSLLPKLKEPSRQLAVLLATVDILCRCVSCHRAAVLAGSAASVSQQTEKSGSAVPPLPLAAALPEPAHINADDLLGLLSFVAIHTDASYLHSTVAALADYAGEEQLIEKPGFFLTSLQAGLLYAINPDILMRVRCGHCEVIGSVPVVVCKCCGRKLCEACDATLHSMQGEAPLSQHERITLPRLSDVAGIDHICSAAGGDGGSAGRSADSFSEPVSHHRVSNSTNTNFPSPAFPLDRQDSDVFHDPAPVVEVALGYAQVAAAASELLSPGTSRYTLEVAAYEDLEDES